MTHGFSESLAAIVPGAVARLGFLEQGVKHVLDRELIAWRANPDRRLCMTVVEGEGSLRDGLLLTDPGFPEVPACMIWFEFDSDVERSRVVTLWGVGRCPALDEIEDYTGGP